MPRKAKICVVDDDEIITDVLCTGLQAHDFEAVSSTSGEHALELCIQDDIDIVLLDVSMPGMSGYDLCRELQQHPETKQIAVIFVTAKGEPEDHEKGFELGAVDYITKPFNLPMVMVRVEAAMRMKRATPQELLKFDAFTHESDTDHLTGLRSKKFLMERFQEEIDKGSRYDFPISCVIIDVDIIEAQDSEKGPVHIEDLLPEIAMEIRTYTRSYDVLSRYDGTLFVAILPHTDLENAMEYGSKIMRDIDATTFSDPGFPSKVAVSVAVTTLRDGIIASAERAFGDSMKVLLQAKSMPRPDRIKGISLKAESKSA